MKSCLSAVILVTTAFVLSACTPDEYGSATTANAPAAYVPPPEDAPPPPTDNSQRWIGPEGYSSQ